MIRTTIVALSCALLFGQAAGAQQWAVKMFDSTSHDFGTVARGSQSEHRFQIKNIYKETAHVASVRSSCGCSSARIINPTIKTYETGEIAVAFNTRSFLGHRGATITVNFDQPFPAEVQLQVKGYIRSDVVISPGVVQFDNVDHGSTAERKVTVAYAGRSDWELVDVLSANSNFEVEVKKVGNVNGRVTYDLLVRLTGNVPVGYLNEQLILVTNDERSPRLPLAVEGRIVPDITVSPTPLYLGDVPMGGSITKQIVVRGREPFKIVAVNCDDQCFTFKKSDESKALHLVAVTFQADHAGKNKHTIHIVTDRDGQVDTAVDAYATVADEPATATGP